MDFTKCDLHVHTKLSLCANRNAEAADYIKAAAENNIETIGFSDHYWDETVFHPNLIGFYQQQNTEHVLQLKHELETIDHCGVNVLFGCETEFAGHTLGISEEKTKLFDYIIVPHSHTHMYGFVLPEDMVAPADHARYLVESFLEVANHPIAKECIYGIVHPFNPVGKNSDDSIEILKNISNEDYIKCAKAAKNNSVKIELNSSSLVNQPESLMNEYKRFFKICYNEGCEFFAGSDKHSVVYDKSTDAFFKLDDVAEFLFS